MMPRKKAKQRFRAVTAVKAAARERIGTPPASRVEEPEKNKRGQPKHKKKLSELLQEES